MNIVQQIITNLSDEELKKALSEMKELEDSGVLPDGQIRDLARRLQDDAGLSPHDARSVAEDSILRIAAFKWAGIPLF